jgi:hypothetical protein
MLAQARLHASDKGKDLLAYVNRPESSSAAKVHDSRAVSDLGD